MLVKASSVTNLTDARYFAAKEVNYLGFNLEAGTPGYLDPIYMKAIREWVEGPHIVGEFSKLPIVHIVEAVEFLGLDVVQLDATHHLERLSDFYGAEVILKVDGNMAAAEIEAVFHRAAPAVSSFLLDFSDATNWEGRLLEDTDFWNELLMLRPTLLQADLTVEQIAPLFSRLNLAGLSLVGGEEEAVGVKSFDLIDEIFDAIEE